LIKSKELRIDFRKVVIEPNLNQSILADTNHIQANIKVASALVNFSETHKTGIKQM
jgi:hypothetical protein